MADQRRTDGTADGSVRRRTVLKTTAAVAAASALARPLGAHAQESDAGATVLGPGPVPVSLRVNGEERDLSVEPRRTLLDALRTDLDLTGCKEVCDRGHCGACTVWLDGAPVYSCTLLAVEVDGAEVTTVEGLGTPERLHPVQDAFRRFDALQCGFCTPGMVMACAAAVRTHGKALDEETLRGELTGNLCRCGTYPHVLAAGLDAAKGGK